MKVFTPTDQGYDDERTGYQRFALHEPALIVAATSPDDVLDAVARGLPVAVQASGHGLTTPLRGGVLITTHGMSGVRVDPSAKSAYVEAGATWQQVIDAAAPHGLAPPSGSSPGVGAISYTLGGGIGLLARRYGFASDHVRRFDIVTADGRLRSVSDGSLFWALRGGGGMWRRCRSPRSARRRGRTSARC